MDTQTNKAAPNSMKAQPANAPASFPLENDDLATAARQAGLVDGCGGADPKFFYARTESELTARAAARFRLKPVHTPTARPWLRFDSLRVLLTLSLALGLVVALQHFGLSLWMTGLVLVAVVVGTVAFLEIVERHTRITQVTTAGQKKEEAEHWVRTHSARICGIYDHHRTRAGLAVRWLPVSPTPSVNSTKGADDNHGQQPAAC